MFKRTVGNKQITMIDTKLIKLAEKYLSDMAGRNVVSSIKIHADIAKVNTRYIVFQGAERTIVLNVFKAANSQNKLDNLINVINAEIQSVHKNASDQQIRFEIKGCSKYVFIGNLLADARYDLFDGDVVNTSSAKKKVIITMGITGTKQECYFSLVIPENGKVMVPKIQIPRFSHDELLLINRTVFPATITLKMYLAGDESLLDVFQTQVYISQPDFILIAQELENGHVEDHSRILSWLVNSGADGINNFVETSVIPQIGRSTGYPVDLENKKYIRNQVIAVYESLKKLKLNFVPTELLNVNESGGRLLLQRVQSPDKILKGQSTYINCLDGVILFSSLLERLNLEPLIIVVPGHALVGWKNLPNCDCTNVKNLLSNCEYLDVTLISDNLDFFSAVSSAEAYIIKYLANFKEELSSIEDFARIVDVKNTRNI